jgi:hypothetical protein
MQKLKHIKHTKLSPILSKQYLPKWSHHSVARPHATSVAIFIRLLVLGSRHLVFGSESLGNSSVLVLSEIHE